MTEKALDATPRSSTTPTTTPACWRRRRAGSTRTSSASSCSATSRSAGTRASSARSGTSATTWTRKRDWDTRLGLGREKIFEVRKLYNDVTFIDEFFTPEFCVEQKFYTFGFNERSGNWEIMSREFKKVKEKLLLAADQPRPAVHLRRGRQLREPRRAAAAPHPRGHRPRRRPGARHAAQREQAVDAAGEPAHQGRGQGQAAALRGRQHQRAERGVLGMRLLGAGARAIRDASASATRTATSSIPRPA